MSLISLDKEKAKQKIATAVDQHIPIVNDLRKLSNSLKIQELRSRQCTTVAPVASDGGENKIIFEPLNLEIIRVVDSRGNEHILEIIPIISDPTIFQNMFNEIECLQRMLTRLDIHYQDVSDFLPASPQNSKEWNTRLAISELREIVEWAVLLDLAWADTTSPVLLLRDGLLRTLAFKHKTLLKLSASFEEAYQQTGSMLIGVAKQSKVINYLSLALELERPFSRDFPCYCEVPEEIERRAYKQASDWLSRNSFGKLHLVKLTDLSSGLLLPVDVPSWLLPRRKEVLEYLASTAKTSFPKIGYPYPLIQAHEHAFLGQFEMSFLSDFVIEALLDKHSHHDRTRILSHLSFNGALYLEGSE